MKLAMCLFAILLLIAPASATQQTLEDQAVARSEAAIGKQLPALTFVDTRGAKIALADLRGKPLLISLVYTGFKSKHLPSTDMRKNKVFTFLTI